LASTAGLAFLCRRHWPDQKRGMQNDPWHWPVASLKGSGLEAQSVAESQNRAASLTASAVECREKIDRGYWTLAIPLRERKEDECVPCVGRVCFAARFAQTDNTATANTATANIQPDYAPIYHGALCWRPPAAKARRCNWTPKISLRQCEPKPGTEWKTAGLGNVEGPSHHHLITHTSHCCASVRLMY
jgi:hypothetical protein